MAAAPTRPGRSYESLTAVRGALSLIAALAALHTLPAPSHADARIPRSGERPAPVPLTVPSSPFETQLLPRSADTGGRRGPAPSPLHRADDEARARTPGRSGAPSGIGGDDVLVTIDPTSFNELPDYSMDISNNGDIYVAYASEHPVRGWEVVVKRSQDGGNTWKAWSVFSDPDPGVNYTGPVIRVANSTTLPDQVFLAYVYDPPFGLAPEVWVARADAAGSTGAWSFTQAMSEGGLVAYDGIDFMLDDDTWPSYYIYLAAVRHGPSGDEIHFTRSFDRGLTFEASVAIGPNTSGDSFHLERPQLAYGAGGIVHATWQLTPGTGAWSHAVIYRRALADGATWQAITLLTSAAEVYGNGLPSLAASQTDGDVVLVYEDFGLGENDGILRVSTDSGASFGPEDTSAFAGVDAVRLRALPDGSEFAAVIFEAFPEWRWGIMRADGANPGVWSGPEFLSDVVDPTSIWHLGWAEIAADPTRGNRWSACWLKTDEVVVWLTFDAEWRADPGYPNLENGFPVGLAAAGITHPALANVDADAELEIVFGDAAGRVHVFDPDGTERPGWPQDIGAVADRSAIAVGHLDSDGVPEIVVGGVGEVYAFTPDGNVLPGFPVALGNEPVFPCLGDLGGVHPAWIVATTGSEVHLLDVGGNSPPAFTPHALGDPAVGPAAVGDLDLDGIAEYVVAAGRDVYVFRMGTLVRTIPFAWDLTAAVSLADFDLDGDLEITAPALGWLTVVHHDGVGFGGGWPIQISLDTEFFRPAIAHFLDTPTPGVGAAAFHWLYAITTDGVRAPGFPPSSVGFWDFGSGPILDRVDDTRAAITAVDMLGTTTSFRHTGDRVEGWPKDLGADARVSPASGDIDNDGRTEIVYLTNAELVVVDVGTAPETDPKAHWPMYGYDVERSGCLDCTGTTTTTVIGAGAGAAGGVSLSVPAPNPTAGPSSVRFEVPRNAVVSLDVFDVGGRHTATIIQGVVGAGGHTVRWDGMDRHGRRVAPGQYFVRLRVEGSTDRVRKVTVLR